MKKKRYLMLFLFMIISIYAVADNYLKDKVADYLKSKEISYSNISMNLFLGNITLNTVFKEKDSLIFKVEKIEVKGVSYYQFIKNNAIRVASLKATNPKVNGKVIKNDKPLKSFLKDSVVDLEIGRIYIDNLKIDVLKNNNFPFKVKSINFKVENFKLDSTLSKSIPFSYSNIESSITYLETQYSKVQKVKFSKLTFKERNLSIDSLEIVPLKNKKEYIRFVSEEKELLTLFSKKIIINDLKIEEKEKLSFSSKHILLDEVFFNLYLDATLLEHPNKRKDLYSKNLRDLPFNINVEKLNIVNSQLVYKEYTIKGNKAGFLIFDDLNAEIVNINNKTNKKTKLTTAKITSQFMKASPLEIIWTFDITNKNDNFRIRGGLFHITSKNMSSFLLPTMNVKMDGFIDKMFFDFEGNDSVSNGKLDVDFKNFNIKILDKEKDKKTVISWLVNLFIKDSSKNGLVKVTVDNLERDKTRSFWNYFWKNIEKGLEKSLI
ncbi:hypothetical protein [Polaribacter staleyi]|uniref:hypothetical protein n=1 Tax=Polaribacter staleyi TaxID=2022337 RepID=UPI0031B9BBC0